MRITRIHFALFFMFGIVHNSLVAAKKGILSIKRYLHILQSVKPLKRWGHVLFTLVSALFITGGYTNSVEAWIPANSSSCSLPSMTMSRASTQSLLQVSSVVVAGMMILQTRLARCGELKPRSGRRWSPTWSMKEMATCPGETLLVQHSYLGDMVITGVWRLLVMTSLWPQHHFLWNMIGGQ